MDSRKILENMLRCPRIIRLRLPVYDKYYVEMMPYDTVPAMQRGSTAVLMRAPAFAYGYAQWDKVRLGAPLKDAGRWAGPLVAPSGYSTLRISIMQEAALPHLATTCRSFGMELRPTDFPLLYVLAVPPQQDYLKLRSVLEQGARTGAWDFEEACLNHYVPLRRVLH